MSGEAQSFRDWSRDLGLPDPDVELLSDVAVERVAVLRAERDALEAERSRYRTALEEASEHPCTGGGWCASCIARAALDAEESRS